MGKREFLEILAERLSEELSRERVISHLQYYEYYIDNEIKKGRKSEAVMAELGDPILIAHTIINTETGESFRGYAEDAEFVEISDEQTVDESEDQRTDAYTEQDRTYTYVHAESEEQRQAREYEAQAKNLQNKRRMGCVIGSIMIGLLLFGVLFLVGGLLSILLPILLPLGIVLLVLSFVLGKKS